MINEAYPKNINLDTPLVSVIINCYNGSSYLREAIDSIYAQTYTNWEIIFWDNCSVDESAQIAKSYDDKVNYYCGEKTIPLYAARNKALECCNGDVIAFLDVDDVWVSDKLDKQIALFTIGNRIVYGGFEFIDSFGISNGVGVLSPPSGSLFTLLLIRNPISIGSVIIDAALIKEYMFDSTYELLGDFDLWVRLSLSNQIISVPGVVEYSRQHTSNFSKINENKWICEERYFYKKIIKTISPSNYFFIFIYMIRSEVKNFIKKIKNILFKRISIIKPDW